MRRHGFVKREGGRVTGTGQNAEDEGAEAAADLGDFVGVRQELNEKVDHAAGAKTGRKHAGSNDDAEDVGVAFTHAVEELLRGFLRIRAGDGKRIHGTDQHGRGNGNLDAGDPEGDDNKEHHRNERSDGVEDVHLEFRIGCSGILREFAFKAFRTVVLVDHADDRHQNDGGNAETQGHHAVRTDEGHHVHAGELRNERVMRDAGVKCSCTVRKQATENKR